MASPEPGALPPERLPRRLETVRFYVDEDRPSYQEEKQSLGEMPDEPLAERYFDDEYDWERSYDLLDRHK